MLVRAFLLFVVSACVYSGDNAEDQNWDMHLQSPALKRLSLFPLLLESMLEMTSQVNPNNRLDNHGVRFGGLDWERKNIDAEDPRTSTSRILEACVFSNSKYGAIVVFRPTVADSKEDWFNNARFYQRLFILNEDRAGKVHLGFYEEYEKKLKIHVQSHLDDIRERFRWQNMPVYCVGHSRGGALAAIAALHIRHLFPRENQLSIISFGGPLIGDQELCLSLNNGLGKQNIIRFECRTDVVPAITSIIPREFCTYRAHGTCIDISFREHAYAQAFNQIRTYKDLEYFIKAQKAKIMNDIAETVIGYASADYKAIFSIWTKSAAQYLKFFIDLSHAIPQLAEAHDAIIRVCDIGESGGVVPVPLISSRGDNFLSRYLAAN